MGLPRGHGFGFTGSQESRIGIEAERQRESAVSRQEGENLRKTGNVDEIGKKAIRGCGGDT